MTNFFQNICICEGNITRKEKRKLNLLMASEGIGVENSPTWAVAIVCSCIVVISLAFERSLHFLGKASHALSCLWVFFPTILAVLLFMILMMIFGIFFEYWFVYRSVVFEGKEPEISLWSLAKDQRRYISSSFFCEHLKIHKILSFNKLNLNVS